MQGLDGKIGIRVPLMFAGLLAIVGGGRCDVALLRKLAAAGAGIVAADGGATNVAAADLEPEAIIGDLDSLDGREAWQRRTRVIDVAEQRTTDFEKCLYLTEAKVTVALGMTGARLDHTLAALETMTRYAQKRRIVLVDETDLALAISGAFDFWVEEGARVSVHPLAPVRFARSEGLVYPLDGLTLAPGLATGTSNAATEGPFRIAPAEDETGPWLLTLELEYLDRLVQKLLGDEAP